MKYRTKLYISLVVVSCMSILLGLIIFSTETEKLILHLLRSRTLSIAATAATKLDPNLFKETSTTISQDSPAYKRALRILTEIRNANRREDVYVQAVYTLYPDPNNPEILRYAVDAEPGPLKPGSVYRDSDKELILKNLNSYIVDPYFTPDQWGVWLSAFAPIRDKEGKYIATLGIDINAADIQAHLQEIIKYAIWGLSSSLVLALLLGFFLSKKVTQSLDHLCQVVKEIGEGNLNAKAKITTHDEFGILSQTINQMAEGLRERERLKMSFARYVSHHVLEQILKSETPLKLEGERRKVTLLFSDIRQFTLLAEKLPPEEVVLLLNEYFEQMIDVIFSFSGTLDKFIGDGIMAEFGAPLDDKIQEEHAIQAAIEMQKTLNKLCDKWEMENKPRISMGVGIHTGEVIIGNIGSERRFEYTAIGDSVNVAARLEQATKILKVPILISETTYAGCKDKFPFKDLGTMALPGRREQIRVYTVDKN